MGNDNNNRSCCRRYRSIQTNDTKGSILLWIIIIIIGHVAEGIALHKQMILREAYYYG